MPVRHGLLALLGEGPSHGYQLKVDFEARTGGSWTLNIGQVYTTLARLERDGLVIEVDDPEPDPDRRTVAVTDEGRKVAEEWFATPVEVGTPPRDELTIKVLLALAAPDLDLAEVLQQQRRVTLESLQELTRRKRALDPDTDLAALLQIDAEVLRIEAQARWLDQVEQRLAVGRRPATS
ncbi:MAG: PadR family transcriptional regulator [Nitriliruptoraceae bacterium]|nr:PadR family transcriptional regulator [Nitriliruptoraceae bacterium]